MLERPIMVLGSLATIIGLKEAVAFAKINEVTHPTYQREGKYWICYTQEQWNKIFPFWSELTIKRTLTRLENLNLLISGNFNKHKSDNTKWYTFNIEGIEACDKLCGGNHDK